MDKEPASAMEAETEPLPKRVSTKSDTSRRMKNHTPKGAEKDTPFAGQDSVGIPDLPPSPFTLPANPLTYGLDEKDSEGNLIPSKPALDHLPVGDPFSHGYLPGEYRDPFKSSEEIVSAVRGSMVGDALGVMHDILRFSDDEKLKLTAAKEVLGIALGRGGAGSGSGTASPTPSKTVNNLIIGEEYVKKVLGGFRVMRGKGGRGGDASPSPASRSAS